MNTLAWLLPIALFLGGLGLVGFLWALRSGQYEDLDGAAERILTDPPELGPETGDGAGKPPEADRKRDR